MAPTDHVEVVDYTKGQHAGLEVCPRCGRKAHVARYVTGDGLAKHVLHRRVLGVFLTTTVVDACALTTEEVKRLDNARSLH